MLVRLWGTTRNMLPKTIINCLSSNQIVFLWSKRIETSLFFQVFMIFSLLTYEQCYIVKTCLARNEREGMHFFHDIRHCLIPRRKKFWANHHVHWTNFLGKLFRLTHTTITITKSSLFLSTWEDSIQRDNDR